jgi:hypothetical protein
MALSFLDVLERNGFDKWKVPSDVLNPPLAVLEIDSEVESIKRAILITLL